MGERASPRSIRVPRHLLLAALIVAGIAPAAVARAATFTLGFDGVPEAVGGSPGDTVRFEAYVTLSVTDNESPEGAAGWGYAVGVRGGTFSAVDVAGIKVSTVYDEDHDKNEATPPVRHDPFEFDLGSIASTKTGLSANHICTAQLGEEDLGTVAASVIVLSYFEKMVLQPTGAQRIGRITVQATVPLEGVADDDCSPVELYVLEGADVICLDAFGRRISCAGPSAVITHEGQSRPASLDTGSAQVCITRFRRGDATADARVDLADAVSVLNFLFLGGQAPICRDSADANNDAALDLTDPILILTRLFTAASTTVIPTPGIYACGIDPEPDSLNCAASAGC